MAEGGFSFDIDEEEAQLIEDTLRAGTSPLLNFLIRQFNVVLVRNFGDDQPTTSSSSSTSNARGDGNSRDFDPTLPTSHNYLGNNLEELRGRTVLDDGSYQVLSLLPQPGVVLVPGQTLPLMVFYPPTISMLRNLVATNGTFGVVCVRDVVNPELASFGTTAEIYEYKNDESTAAFCIKAKGRQRFHIAHTQRQVDGNVTATVRILPEIQLPNSLHETRQHSLDRFRSQPSDLTRPITPATFRRQTRLQTIGRRDAMMTAWPQWVHKQYEPQHVANQIRKEFSDLKLGGSDAALQLPEDPTELSFWVAQAMPLLDEQKISLLMIDSTIQRLRWELSVLTKCQMLCCIGCDTQIADPKSTFSMSVEGPQGTYVNPGGFVHETLTVHKARGLKCVNAQPSTEHSWFPGYGWTIAECKYCHKHIGWKFTATDRSMRPQKFWGLCRKSIINKLIAEDTIHPVM